MGNTTDTGEGINLNICPLDFSIGLSHNRKKTLHLSQTSFNSLLTSSNVTGNVKTWKSW